MYVLEAKSGMVLIDKCHHNNESALILNQTNWVLWNKAFYGGVLTIWLILNLLE